MCSSAAVNNASRVGKWCCAAPRETPACSATTATVLAVQPCSARHSIADSSSRARVARERSCCGSRSSAVVISLGRPRRRPFRRSLLQEGEHALLRLGGGEQPRGLRLHLVGEL